MPACHGSTLHRLRFSCSAPSQRDPSPPPSPPSPLSAAQPLTLPSTRCLAPWCFLSLYLNSRFCAFPSHMPQASPPPGLAVVKVSTHARAAPLPPHNFQPPTTGLYDRLLALSFAQFSTAIPMCPSNVLCGHGPPRPLSAAFLCLPPCSLGSAVSGAALFLDMQCRVHGRPYHLCTPIPTARGCLQASPFSPPSVCHSFTACVSQRCDTFARPPNRRHTSTTLFGANACQHMSQPCQYSLQHSRTRTAPPLSPNCL